MTRGLQKSPAWESAAFVALPLDFTTCFGLWICWMWIRKHQDKHLAHVPVISEDLGATAIATKQWSQTASPKKKGKSKDIQILDLESCNISMSLSESDILHICVFWSLHILSVGSHQLCSVAHLIPSLGWNPALCHPCLKIRGFWAEAGVWPGF